MACLLLFGLATGLLGLARKGECPPFVVGFEAAGWATLFAYASFLAVNYDYKYRTLDRIRPITNFFYPNGCAYADIPVMSLHMTILFLPELFLALAGGFLSARLGLVLAWKAERDQAALDTPEMEERSLPDDRS